MKNLKRYIISGLIFIIPISLSIWILFKTINFLENILGIFVKKFFPAFYTPGLGVVSLVLIVIFIGFLAHNFLGRKLLRIVETLFEKVPLINRIYLFIKGIIENIFQKKRNVFKKAVKIEFINGTYTIGFLTGKSDFSGNFVSVFVPTVPNITTGFYLLVPEEKVEILDIPVEEALKIVVSMGMFEPERKNSKKKNGSHKK